MLDFENWLNMLDREKDSEHAGFRDPLGFRNQREAELVGSQDRRRRTMCSLDLESDWGFDLDEKSDSLDFGLILLDLENMLGFRFIFTLGNRQGVGIALLDLENLLGLELILLDLGS